MVFLVLYIYIYMPILYQHFARCRFAGARVTAVAIEPMRAGEELRLCYGPQAGRHPRELRQTMLKDQYGFHCACRACMSGYVLVCQVRAYQARAVAHDAEHAATTVAPTGTPVPGPWWC